MATWVRSGTGTAPSDTDSNLVGNYALDNATAPVDFDPAGVNSVRIQWSIAGSGFSDDSWNDNAGCALETGTTEISQHAGGGTTGNQNTTIAHDVTDSTGIPTGLSTAQWEAALVRGDGTLIPDEWCEWVKNKGPDGSTLTVSAVTVTIDYTPDISPQALTGTLFTKAPSFGTGTVTNQNQFLTGTVYALAPTFPTGAVSQPSDLGYIENLGTNLTFVECPDSDLADPSGDFELIVLVENNTWLPTSWSPLVTKHDGTGDLGYLYQLRPSGSNHFERLEVYDAANASAVNQSSNFNDKAPPSPLAPRWFRVALDVDDGAGNHVVSWFYSDDPPETAIGSITWTAIGVDTVAGAITSFPDTTASTKLMGATFSSEQSQGAGKLFCASIRYGGTEVADPDFRIADQTSDSGATFVDSYGNTWTNPYNWVEPAASSGETLTGTTFTKAPTFPAGTVTPGAVGLTGTLSTRAPTFNTGTIGASTPLTGTLFAQAPSFVAGSITATFALTGTLFSRAPTFGTGAVTADQALAGTLFTRVPTFFGGTLGIGASSVQGVLFSQAPTFFVGAVTPGAVTLTGTVYTRAPSFGSGAVTTDAVALTGTLFSRAPTFPAGAISTGPVTLTGTLFAQAPTFGGGAISLGGVVLTGITFTKAPTFTTGEYTDEYGDTYEAGGEVSLASFTQNLTGTLFTKAPTFGTGALLQGQTITKTVDWLTRAPTFPKGAMGPFGDPEWVGATPADGTVHPYLTTDTMSWGFVNPAWGFRAYRLVRARGTVAKSWDWASTIENWRAEFQTSLSFASGGLRIETTASTGANPAFESTPSRSATDIDTHGVPVVAGRTYSVMYRVKSDSLPNIDFSIRARFYWYDNTGTFIGQNGLTFSGNEMLAHANDVGHWHAGFSTTEVTAPVGAVRAIINMFFSNSVAVGTTAVLDGLAVLETSEFTGDHLQYATSAGWNTSAVYITKGNPDQAPVHKNTNHIEGITGALPANFAVFYLGLINMGIGDPGYEWWAAPLTSVLTTLDQLIEGTTFTKAPAFGVGTLVQGIPVVGTLFTKAPSFGTGAITVGPVSVTGTLFAKAPSFPQGEVERGVWSLTGTTLTRAPSFFGGVITAGQPVQGTLFTKAPTFPTGSITTGAVTLSGATYVQAPTFPTGSIVTPLVGTAFTSAPVFGTGSLSAVYSVVGTGFQRSPIFPTGIVLQDATFLTGATFQISPVFFAGLVVAPSVIDARPWEFAYFARDNDGNLRYVIHEPQVRIRPPGSRVTSTFRWNRTNYDRTFIDLAIDDAWEANKAASVPDLQDALHAALSAVGIKNRHGQTLP